MAIGDFSVTDLEAYLVVNGTQYDAIQVTVDFGLNEIPSASVLLPAGGDAGGSLLSNSEELINSTSVSIPAEIWCSAKVSSSIGREDQWPDGPFRIFDGAITGSGFRRTSRGIELEVSLTHWLSNLSFSSTLSRTSSPLNPCQISYYAALPAIGGPNAGGGTLHNTPMTQPGPIFSETVIASDFWGQGLKVWFESLAAVDRINWLQISTIACGATGDNPSGQKNEEALAALSRIEPNNGAYKYGVPLSMRQRNGMSRISQTIAAQIGLETPEAICNHTFWDKIVGQYGSDMQFAVAPMVEQAVIVPFIPGLRTPWKIISAEEYEFLELSNNVPRPLRGVGLFVGREMAAGASMPSNMKNLPVVDMPGAYYENAERNSGQVIFKKAPRWLSPVIGHLFNPANQSQTIANAYNSNPVIAAIVNAIGVLTGKSPKTLVEESKSLWCDYARALYYQEILRGRAGRLSGRLRFDIAPGSTVKIDEPSNPFAGSSGGSRFAQVIRVSCVLNAEAQKAGTAFQFAFTRSDSENSNDAYSTDSHPIWSCTWPGGPLADYDVFNTGVPPTCTSGQ